VPSYDYRCQECKTEFTVERSMTDNSQPNCLDCGSENASRVWIAVQFAAGGSTPDYGQGTSRTSSTEPRKSACGSCVSRACGTCH
jgi:putative FmdB family regulatory protein